MSLINRIPGFEDVAAPMVPSRAEIMAERERCAEEEHFPWHYTEYGVICACGSPMTRDEKCASVGDSRPEADRG